MSCRPRLFYVLSAAPGFSNGKSRDSLVLEICFLFLDEQINKLVCFSEGFIKMDWKNKGANGMVTVSKE